jgi:nucleoid-associated protein YgaU
MFDSGVDAEQAFGQDDGVARTHVRRRRTGLTAGAVLLLAVLLGPVGDAFRAGAADRHPGTVVVRPGDSLWAIARRIEPQADPRPLVDAIAVANDVDAGSLVPGQRLVVPAP